MPGGQRWSLAQSDGICVVARDHGDDEEEVEEGTRLVFMLGKWNVHLRVFQAKSLGVISF